MAGTNGAEVKDANIDDLCALHVSLFLIHAVFRICTSYFCQGYIMLTSSHYLFNTSCIRHTQHFLRRKKDVGMAYQKVCKQGRDNTQKQSNILAKPHPYFFFTVQLDSAWGSS